MKELRKRIIVALWGIPMLAFVTYMGGYYFLALLLTINGLALWEFYSMYQHKDIYPYRLLGIVLGSIFLIVSFLAPQFQFACLLFIVISINLIPLLQSEKMGTYNSAFTIIGFTYVSFLLAALLRLRIDLEAWLPMLQEATPNPGGNFVLILLASIWLCDTAAYLGGKQWGRNKLAPSISPNKTIEGAIFGLLFGILTFYIAGQFFLPGLPFFYIISSGIIVGIFGQLGDLLESHFKRDAGVKDSSELLPGHGGILDRFDSLIFVAPFLWGLFYFGSLFNLFL